MRSDERAARKPYAVRHFKLSPEADISPAQEAEAVAVVALKSSASTTSGSC